MEICLYDRTRSRTHRVHRLVAEAFIGPYPEGKVINHLDFDRSNNSVRNLEYITQTENIRHSVACNPRADWGKNLREMDRRGELHPRAKLTEDTVRKIRHLRRQGFGPSHISKRLGVHRSSVGNILYKGGWSHVK